MFNTSINDSTYLLVIIKDEPFLILVRKVLKVLQNKKIAKVPEAPSNVKGILNFQGSIIPVFESCTKFGLAKRLENEKFVILVLEIEFEQEKIIIGTTADSVRGVINIESHQVKPVPKMGGNLSANFLDGVFNNGNEFIMLLNIDKAFSQEDIKSLVDEEGLIEEQK